MDSLSIGLICGGAARVYAISGTELVETARQVHGASFTAISALGRSLLGTVLLAAMQKEADSDVSLVIKGGGPLGNIVCVGKNDAIVKGYAENPALELPLKENRLDVGGAVGSGGTLTVVRNTGWKEPYAGTVNLVSGEIAEDVAQYLLASEQQESLVYLGVNLNPDGTVRAAGGILIQPLPECPDSAINDIANLSGSIQLLTIMLESDLTLLEILAMLLEKVSFEPLRTITPYFHCDCTWERLEQAVISMGGAEIRDIMEQDGQAELTCSFCRRKYVFSKSELERLLAAAEGART